MKALVLKDSCKFDYEDVANPEYAENEVLVKIEACAICGSDVHGMDGSSGRRQVPIIMGHEAAGVIEEVGSRVKGFKKGDRVTFDSTIYCGECYYCRQGQVNLCDNRRVLGVSCDNYRRHGAMAEYINVPQHILYPLPDNVTFEQASLIEPLTVALHAVRISPVEINTTAVVVGAGMIGLLIVELLKTAGCGQIIVVDLDESRLELAKESGATTVLQPDKTDVVEEVLKLTADRGADLSFEAVGIDPTVDLAISVLRKGGSVTLVGNLKADVNLPLQKVVTRQLTINGSCASAGEYPDCIDLIARKAVDIDKFISKVVPLEDGARWFDKLYEGNSGLFKVILKPGEEGKNDD